MKHILNFLRNLKTKDEILIISHNDTDGICASVLMDIFIEKQIKKKSFMIFQPMPVDKNLIERIGTTFPSKIIFLDLAIDQQPKILKRIAGICQTAIIDHHIYYKNMNSKRISHYNPRFKNPKIYQSASYLVYKICSKITDISNYMWIALTGAIGDYNLNDSKDLISEARKKYKFQNPKPYETIFGKISDVIAYATSTREMKSEEVAEILRQSENPEDFINSKKSHKILKIYEIIKNEINKEISDAESTAEKIGNIIIYELKSNYNIRSIIATKLSEKYPKKLIIVYSKNNKKYKISLRNQGKNINTEKILRQTLKGLNATYGGHEAASAANIHEDDWNNFRENLTSLQI